MRVGIIATDYGEHSAEKLAANCAAQLIEFNWAMMDGARVMQAKKLEMDIIEALIPHHSEAQIETRSELISNAAAHFAKPPSVLLHPGDRLQEAIDAVIACAVGTPWQDEFKTDAARAHLHAVIGQYLVDTQHLERLYHSDRNPDDAAAKAYKENPTGTLVLGMGE
jgi:hypothetical protein